MAIQPGSMLKGQYRIDALIGGGGMALVYRAFDLNLQRVCAIKQNLDTSPEAQRQFHLEAILLANLSHPHLSRVTDHFVDTTGQQYLVMDFVEGEDLDAYVRRTGPMTERQALAWMSGIFDALSYCHGQGVIHRDVKPANLVKRRGEDTVVLVDFGIAKSQAGGMTLAGAQAASPAYAPLEQFVGHTDPRSDVYALGATLYYLLTGHEPPDARLVASGVEQITPPRALNPAISPRTEQSVLHALALRVADRPQSVAALAAALASHPPQPPGPTVRPTRPPARRASSIALAAVALLGVLAVMLFALNRLGGNGGGVAATATVAIVAALPSPETTTPATAASMQPTETATLSAATVSPSGAATDTPTAGRSPTSTPAATDTSTPRPTNTPRPAQQPPVAPPQQPPASNSAPRLTAPADGSEQRGTVTLQWAYDRGLQPGQTFQVDLRTEHNQPARILSLPASTGLTLQVRFDDYPNFFKDDNATYFWSVVVMNANGPLQSMRSEERRFVLKRDLPAASATDTPQPPTVEPPTVEPPTVEPPTVEPPTVAPPTATPTPRADSG